MHTWLVLASFKGPSRKTKQRDLPRFHPLNILSLTCLYHLSFRKIQEVHFSFIIYYDHYIHLMSIDLVIFRRIGWCDCWCFWTALLKLHRVISRLSWQTSRKKIIQFKRPWLIYRSFWVHWHFILWVVSC